MEKLEKIPICCNKLRVLRQAYQSEEDMKHYNCNSICLDYIPYHNNGDVNLRHGRIAFELMRA